MTNEIKSSDSQSTDINNSIQPTSITSYDTYHNSVCGGILYTMPTNSPSEIFSYLRHGKFDAFRRSFDIYHKDIIKMKNEQGQTVLHVLTIYAYPYHWVRLLIMRGCDPCCQDNDGYTPVHYAVERDDVEMLKALTTRFHSEIKYFSEQQINSIHERCLKALTIRHNQGLTPFMLCCFQESIKCLDYLRGININDIDLQDNFGDTCFHYVVARRNVILVDKLINQLQINVNSGNNTRPSALDVLQFNREQQKPFDQTKDNSIEQILLSHNAIKRCPIRRITNKRKASLSDSGSNPIDLSINPSTNPDIEIARNYAQQALSLQRNGDIKNAKEYYKLAMNSISNDILDWADYASSIADLHMVHGEKQLALELYQKALIIRKKYEKESDEINKIQRAIEKIQKI